MQALPVTGMVLVPDHQIDGQAFQPPVGMGLDQLADEIDIGGIADLQQDDRQIAGNRIAPQPGLAAAVAGKHAGIGAQRGIGMDHRTSQPGIKLGIGLGRIELTQDHLAVRPGQVEDAVGEMPILVFLDQAKGHLAALGNARHQVDGHRLFRAQGQQMANGDDRIQHGAIGPGQRTGLAQRQWIGRGPRPTNKALAIGFIGNLANFRSMHRHQMQHPGRPLVGRARSPRTENGAAVAQDLGLHEQVAEGRMQIVRGRRCNHHFSVAGDIDFAALPRAVGDADAAQFDIVLRRDDDLGIGLETDFAAADCVMPAKLGPAFGKNRLVAGRALERWLVCIRPERLAGQIADVTEGAAVVAGTILAPASDGKVVPAAVATAGIGHHHVIAPVRQQLDLGDRRIGRREDPDRHLGGKRGGAYFGKLGSMGEQRSRFGNPLLEQEHHCLELALGRKTALHRAIEQQIS